MADNTYGFRTALNGFHKGDVIGYIEKAATAHRTEILEYENTIMSLRDEIRSLNQQLNLLMMATPIAPEKAPAPVEEPVSALVEEKPAPAPEKPVIEGFVSVPAEPVAKPVEEPAPKAVPSFRDFVPLSFASSEEPAPVSEPKPAAKPEPASEPSSAVNEGDLVMKELQAYRRAEAVERSARAQIRKLCDQVEDMYFGTVDEFSAASDAVKQTVELLNKQAESLEKSYAAFSEALQNSRKKLASINDSLTENPEE